MLRFSNCDLKLIRDPLESGEEATTVIITTHYTEEAMQAHRVGKFLGYCTFSCLLC